MRDTMRMTNVWGRERVLAFPVRLLGPSLENLRRHLAYLGLSLTWPQAGEQEGLSGPMA